MRVGKKSSVDQSELEKKVVSDCKKNCMVIIFDTFDDHFKKMKFSIKDFSCKCDQIRRKLRIWSNFLKKYLMENFFFCVADAIKKVTYNFNSNLYIFYKCPEADTAWKVSK